MFWGVVGRYISKISKKSPFLGKKYIYQLPKILRYIYQSAEDPHPKNTPDIATKSYIHQKIEINILYKTIKKNLKNFSKIEKNWEN